jgi:sodium-dependent dicarboxylate transporter 2/3/5
VSRSPAEERFEKGRRTVGLFLAPVVTIVFALLPIDLPRDEHLPAAILLGVIILWITEPVPTPVGGCRAHPDGRRALDSP